jgi:hypothetical protein
MGAEIKKVADRYFKFAACEYHYNANGATTCFDVFARQGRLTLAFEVETTSRHAVDNAVKASLVGVPLWIVVPRRLLKLKVARKIQPLNLRPGNQPIKILLLGQLQQELMKYLSLIIAANRHKRKE